MRGQWQRCYGSAFMRYLFISQFLKFYCNFFFNSAVNELNFFNKSAFLFYCIFFKILPSMNENFFTKFNFVYKSFFLILPSMNKTFF